jgi:drug/metabolite transporter (DMT)-like permease
MHVAPRERASASLLTAAGFVALALIWGTQFLIIRLGQQTLPPLLTVALRFVILALVAHLLTLALRLHAPPGTGAARLGFGALQALSMSLLYWAEGQIESAIAAIVIMSEPLFVAMLAPWLILGERLSARAIVALACGFAGVLLMIARHPIEGGTGDLQMIATLAVAGSAVVGACARILGKDLVARLPPTVMLRDTGWIVAALSLGGWFAFEREQPTEFSAQAIIAFVYLGVVASAAASGLYLVLLRRYRVTSMAYLQFVTAVVGVATGVLLGREQIGVLGAAGAVIVLAGLAVLVRRARSEGSASPR